MRVCMCVCLCSRTLTDENVRSFQRKKKNMQASQLLCATMQTDTCKICGVCVVWYVSLFFVLEKETFVFFSLYPHNSHHHSLSTYFAFSLCFELFILSFVSSLGFRISYCFRSSDVCETASKPIHSCSFFWTILANLGCFFSVYADNKCHACQTDNFIYKLHRSILFYNKHHINYTATYTVYTVWFYAGDKNQHYSKNNKLWKHTFMFTLSMKCVLVLSENFQLFMLFSKRPFFIEKSFKKHTVHFKHQTYDVILSRHRG